MGGVITLFASSNADEPSNKELFLPCHLEKGVSLGRDWPVATTQFEGLLSGGIPYDGMMF